MPPGGASGDGALVGIDDGDEGGIDALTTGVGLAIGVAAGGAIDARKQTDPGSDDGGDGENGDEDRRRPILVEARCSATGPYLDLKYASSSGAPAMLATIAVEPSGVLM